MFSFALVLLNIYSAYKRYETHDEERTGCNSKYTKNPRKGRNYDRNEKHKFDLYFITTLYVICTTIVNR